jgi:hypothetical protein
MDVTIGGVVVVMTADGVVWVVWVVVTVVVLVVVGPAGVLGGLVAGGVVGAAVLVAGTVAGGPVVVRSGRGAPVAGVVAGVVAGMVAGLVDIDGAGESGATAHRTENAIGR